MSHLGKLVAVHKQPVIQRCGDGYVTVDVIPLRLEHIVNDGGAAYQVASDLAHVVRFAAGIVMVDHGNIGRFHVLYVAFPVLAVHSQKELGRRQEKPGRIYVFQRYFQLVNQNQYIAFCNF